MTRVCFLGSPDVNLRYELLSRETAREALSTYDLERPFENALAVRTVSVGAAVSLCNDLQWYLSRFVDEVFVREPSVSDEEWLSRSLAEALRNGEIEPGETGEYLKVYGVERVGPASADGDGDDRGESDGTGRDDRDGADGSEGDEKGPDGRGESGDRSDRDGPGSAVGRLVEPLYVRRTDGDVPEYDLRDVEETVVVRLTREEYSS